MAITTTQETAIMKTASALFNKAFSPEMVTKFVTFYEANGNDLGKLADALIGSATYETQYHGAATVAEFGTILMAKYGMSYAGTSDADTKMKAFIEYSFAHAADTNSLRTIQAVDKFIVATLLPSITTGNVFATMNTAIANKAEVATTFKNDTANAGKELSLVNVTADHATVDGAIAGQTFTLTTSVDTMPGLLGSASTTSTAGNDTINSVVDSVTATNSTLTALDTINGGNGTDTLNVLATAALTLPTGLTVSAVETANFRAGTTIVADTTTWTGLTAANVTQATSAAITAAATTAVSVSGATTTVAIDGGSTQTVTTAGGNVTLGATTVAAGAINVTHTALVGGTIAVDGGTTVNVTVTGSTGAGAINVGQSAGASTALPTGAISVSSANKAVLATDATLSDITISGGSTITSTQTATSTLAATDTTGSTVTEGDVLITAGVATTSVTATQTATVAEAPYVAAIAAVASTSTVTFGLMAAAGDSVTVNNLTFTAAKALTAAEVAAAFANLSLADLQASGGIVANGIFTGISNTTPWTSGAATGATVTFSAVAGTATPILANTGTAVLPTATAATAGTAATAVTPGVLGVTAGTVTILDTAATATITTVTVDGYKTGSSVGVNGATELQKANALTTLSLANSDAAATFAVATSSAALNLTLNKVVGSLNLDATGTSGIATTNTAVKGLNVTTAIADSTVALQAASVTALTVAGTNVLNLTGSTLTALTTATVSGTAGLTLAGQVQATLTSINTVATTGTVTATIDSTVATYTGGAGNDNVTFSNTTAATKAINLGAGNNKLTLATGTSALTTEMIAGAGTDTLVMASADAESVSGGTTFETKITGFDKLSLGTVAAAADDTINLANMDDISYVIYANGAAAGDTLTLTNMTNNGTLELTAAGLGATVTMTDATSITADSLNIILTAAATAAFGTVAAAGVETVNITATDSLTAFTAVHSMTLSDAAVKTINVTGNAGLTLTNTDNVALTLLDASIGFTGVLTATTNGTVAQTIKGGSGADVLTAHAGSTADVLNGGAGNDILNANAGLSQLTGGAGNDTFVITTSTNLNAASTITDLLSGDVIKFAVAADSFRSAQVTLDPAGNPNLTDYANAAIAASAGANDAVWFQLNGNTYIVKEAGANTLNTFIDGTDQIVKISGLVDLSHASFNATQGTIEIA